MATTRAAAAAAAKKIAGSGTSSLVRRCSDCRLPLWHNFTSAAEKFSASDDVAAKDSSSALMSVLSSASFHSSASSSSFPAAAANAGVGTIFRGTVMACSSQPSKSASVGCSLFSSSASESPPPLPPPPPPYHRENPPDASNPDPVTLQEQWRYATRMYSMWYAHAWGTAILAGVSFFGLGWLIKGENPLQLGNSEKKEEVMLKPK